MDKNLKQLYTNSSEQFTLSDEAKQRVKDNVFAQLGSVVDTTEPVSVWLKLRKSFLRSYVLIPLVVVLFVSGTAYASGNALPGDTLYGVKRTVEEAQILIAPTDEAKLELQEYFAQKRLNELDRIENKQSSKNDSDDEDRINEEVEKEFNDDSIRDNNSDDENSERHKKARQEANKALDKLQNTHQVWRERGDENRAEEIQRRLEQFREHLNNDGNRGSESDDQDSGENEDDNDNSGSGSGQSGSSNDDSEHDNEDDGDDDEEDDFEF